MHSRIFEVVEIKDGAVYEPRIYADEIYDWSQYDMFYDYIVDMDKDEIDNAISWLKDCYVNLFSNDDLEITNEKAEEYFKPKFNELHELIYDLTLEEFSNENYMKLYYIRKALNDNYGFHIVVQNEDGGIYGVYSLDNFIREYRGKFRIVNAFDYHF